MEQRNLRILQSCFSQSWGGLELQALEISSRLHARGHQIWLACIPGSRLHQEAKRYRFHSLPLNVRGYVHPILVARLSKFIRASGIHIIHSHLSRDLATLSPAIRLSGQHVPLVLSKRVGSYLTKKDLFHRLTYANVSAVLAISSVIHRNVLETTPMAPGQVITLHDAIDTERFSPERADRSRIRREFGLGDEMVVIGFVGRFSPGKGHEELLQAAAMIVQHHSNVRFLVAGEASYGEEPYERAIRTMARDLGLDSVVTFTGFRPDVPDLMAAFDILAFPSHAESFGVVLIEAMAMERPVVSTNCDGVLDVVENGKTGIYVEPKKSADMARALEQLITDPLLRERMGKAGRKRVLEMFDQNNQLDKLETVYRSLVKF